LLAAHAERFLEGMETLRRPRFAVRAIGISLVISLLQVATFWAFGRAFGLGLDLVDYVPIAVGPSLVRTFQLTPGDIGPYEVVLTEIIVLLGVATERAAAYAIASHLFILGWTALMGLVAIWLLDLRLYDLLGRWEEPAAP
jgi:uncharacterized membrane protein YbhN (UPF0104 family)